MTTVARESLVLKVRTKGTTLNVSFISVRSTRSRGVREKIPNCEVALLTLLPDGRFEIIKRSVTDERRKREEIGTIKGRISQRETHCN
jgi:hypothetical protein